MVKEPSRAAVVNNLLGWLLAWWKQHLRARLLPVPDAELLKNSGSDPSKVGWAVLDQWITLVFCSFQTDQTRMMRVSIPHHCSLCITKIAHLPIFCHIRKNTVQGGNRRMVHIWPFLADAKRYIQPVPTKKHHKNSMRLWAFLFYFSPKEAKD